MNLTPEQLAADENTSPEELTKLAKQSIELARIVARNVNADPELLEKLAPSEDYLTRQNVAANPNTPTKILFDLGAEFPRQLLDNPILYLLLLEKPNVVSEIPIATLRSLVTQDDIPESFIVECAERRTDKELLLAMTMNSTLSHNILEKLIQSKLPEVTEAAKLHINWSGEITEGWQELAEEKIKAIRPSYSGAAASVYYLQHERPYLEVLAWLGYIPEFLILHWRHHWNVKEILTRIASSINTAPNILAEFGKDENPHMRRIVAGNPSTPSPTLELLVEDNTEDKSAIISGYSTRVRVALCQNYNAPEKVLVKLAQDENFCIRRDVATNIKLPSEIAKILAQDPEEIVRFAIAKNINTPLDSLAELSRDKESRVRTAVATNRNTPVNVLEEMVLLENGNTVSSHKALMTLVELENPNIMDSQLAAWVKRLKEEIQNRNTSQSNSNKKYYVATDPNTPVQVLEDFIQDRSVKDENRMDVITNPNVTTAILEELSKDKNNMIYVENHSYLPERSLKYFVLEKGMACQRAMWSYLKEDFNEALNLIMAGYAKCQYPIVRLIVLLHHQAPENTLRQKSTSSDWLERYAIAQNLSSPIDVLKQLANDGNRVVRAAAKSSLDRQKVIY